LAVLRPTGPGTCHTQPNLCQYSTAKPPDDDDDDALDDDDNNNDDPADDAPAPASASAAALPIDPFVLVLGVRHQQGTLLMSALKHSTAASSPTLPTSHRCGSVRVHLDDASRHPAPAILRIPHPASR